MKKPFSILLLTIAAVFFASCSAKTETTHDTNTHATEPAKSLEATLTDLDKSAGEAWVKKDGRFFESFLANNFVGQTDNGPADKAMVVKYISENDCKATRSPVSEVKITELADGVALLTGKSSPDGTCGGRKNPESYFATLFLKEGEHWRAAYHQSVPIPAKGDAGADSAAGEEEKPAAEGEAKEEGATIMPKIANDAELAKMFAGRESELWLAWAKKDPKPFEEAFAPNYTEIGSMGLMDRAAAIKDISDNKCEVTATSVTDVKATKVNDSVVVVTYKSTAKGSCEGKAMPDVPLYTSSIWKKDGDAWKGVFHMFTPGVSS